MAGYDYDNLHIEIDNWASETGLDPFEALEVWHLGLEVYEKKNNMVKKCVWIEKGNDYYHTSCGKKFQFIKDMVGTPTDNIPCCPYCGLKIKEYNQPVQSTDNLIL